MGSATHSPQLETRQLARKPFEEPIEKLASDLPELTLYKIALRWLAQDKEEFPVSELQNILLPGEAADRQRLAEEVTGVAVRLIQTRNRMNDLCETIDEIVATGLGLTSTEHELIRQRCQQFPLSVTVERPRYVWSADRKRQARRIYQPGERFKK